MIPSQGIEAGPIPVSRSKMPRTELELPENANESERAAQYLVARILRQLDRIEKENEEWNFRPDSESPDKYLARLKTLFPQPAQVSFLEAFWQATKAGHTSAISALIQLMRDKEIGPKAAKYFPPELNTELLTMDPVSDLDQANLRLTPEIAIEVVSACNQAIYYLKELEAEILASAKKSLRTFLGDYKAFLAVKGLREKLSVLNSTLRFIAIAIIAGQDMVSKQLDDYVEKHVTPRYIGLRIDRGMGDLEFIRDHISLAFDPFEMSVYISDLEKVFSDLALPPEIADNLYEAAEVEFEEDTSDNSTDL